MTREQWVEVTKKLRNRVFAHFNAEQLRAIDQFVQLAGQAASFDQVSEDHLGAAMEFQRLSRESKGNSHGWKFNREEIQRKIR